MLPLVLFSCYEEENFPDTPNIEFEDIVFVDTETIDSLILTFTFEDGGADIGLDPVDADLLRPWQVYDVIIDAEDSAIVISEDDIVLPLYKAPVFIDQQNGEIAYFYFPEFKELYSETDNRPGYSCDNYEIIESDTFYVRRNEFYNNFHIEFQKKSGASYVPIDFNAIFANPDCSLGEFDGRIPYYDNEGISGTFHYAMISQAFRLAFLDDSIRVQFYVYDRKLNRSNVVTSPGFLLKDITQTQ